MLLDKTNLADKQDHNPQAGQGGLTFNITARYGHMGKAPNQVPNNGFGKTAESGDEYRARLSLIAKELANQINNAPKGQPIDYIGLQEVPTDDGFRQFFLQELKDSLPQKYHQSIDDQHFQPVNKAFGNLFLYDSTKYTAKNVTENVNPALKRQRGRIQAFELTPTPTSGKTSTQLVVNGHFKSSKGNNDDITATMNDMDTLLDMGATILADTNHDTKTTQITKGKDVDPTSPIPEDGSSFSYVPNNAQHPKNYVSVDVILKSTKPYNPQKRKTHDPGNTQAQKIATLAGTFDELKKHDDDSPTAPTMVVSEKRSSSTKTAPRQPDELFKTYCEKLFSELKSQNNFPDLKSTQTNRSFEVSNFPGSNDKVKINRQPDDSIVTSLPNTLKALKEVFPAILEAHIKSGITELSPNGPMENVEYMTKEMLKKGITPKFDENVKTALTQSGYNSVESFMTEMKEKIRQEQENLGPAENKDKGKKKFHS